MQTVKPSSILALILSTKKMSLKVLKNITHIALFLTFLFSFGINNISRYLQGGITVIKYEEKAQTFPQPG